MVDASAWGLFGLFASAFVSSTLAPGGSEAVFVYLLSRAETPVPLLLATATAGNSLGALTTWGLGLWAARRYPAQALRGDKRLRAVASLRRFGTPLLLLSWLPLVGDGFCFAAGWLRLPFFASLLMIVLGKLARYAALAYLVP